MTGIDSNIINRSEAAYRLLMPVAARINCSPVVVRLAERLFNDEQGSFDAREDWEIVIYGGEVYRLLDVIVQHLIMLLASQELKAAVWQALSAERQASGGMVLEPVVMDKLATLVNSLPAAEVDLARWQWEIIKEEMAKITEVVKRLHEAIESSQHKIYYDYLTTLKLADGTLAVSNRDFLTDELKKINKLLALIRLPTVIDKPLSQLPNIKQELNKVAIIPSGIGRSLPVGTSAYQILIILQRAERVASYFLGQLGSAGETAAPQSNGVAEQQVANPADG